MTHTLRITMLLLAVVFTTKTLAQDADTDGKKKKRKHEVTISNKGIFIHAIDSAMKVAENAPKKEKRFSSSISMDLGVNWLQDNTNYASPSVANYLNVPASQQNKHLFDLRQSKSINVNIYPWLESYKALNKPGQKIYITTGLGLQLYNFRYDNNITYTRNPSKIIDDTIRFTKNKIGLDYLNVPLMFTFKTRISKDREHPKKDKWLVYGVGLTEGLRLASWSKQVSGDRGKEKIHSPFSFADFNTCVTGEIGIDDVIRFYASYQVTSLYNSGTGLDQHPISVGIRISGI